jgi:DNA-binding beta-propeller fold protein YncE
MDHEPVSGCVNALLGKNYILMDDGELMVFDAAADTVITTLSLDSTMEWSLAACAAKAGRVLCAARDTGICALVDCQTDSAIGTVRTRGPVRVLAAGSEETTFVAATAGCLYVIDAETGAIRDSVETGLEPSALCFVAEMHKLYCADAAERCLYVLSTTSDSVVGKVNLGGKPHGICYDSADNRLYVSATQPGAIWVVDCGADSVAAFVDLADSSRPTPPAYSSFGNRVYFASGDSIGVIECCQDKVTSWLPRRFHAPSTPRVFPPLGLVSVVSEDQFVTLFGDPTARPAVVSAAQGRAPTVARGALQLTDVSTGQLFDLSGRRVLDLLPGPNDVSGLAPGVYFAREQAADGSKPAKTRKVVILR